jgi:hypothetical protein
MMPLRLHTYYQRTSFAPSLLHPTSELKSPLSCMVYRLQTINKSRRLRCDLEKYNFLIEFTSVPRLLLGHRNAATTTRSSYLLKCQRMISFSKIWSLLGGSRPRLWSYLIYPRVMSARKQRSWLTTLNGGHRQSVSLPHSRRAQCRFQLTR